jgi:hypothetical protein
MDTRRRGSTEERLGWALDPVPHLPRSNPRSQIHLSSRASRGGRGCEVGMSGIAAGPLMPSLDTTQAKPLLFAISYSFRLRRRFVELGRRWPADAISGHDPGEAPPLCHLIFFLPPPPIRGAGSPLARWCHPWTRPRRSPSSLPLAISYSIRLRRRSVQLGRRWPAATGTKRNSQEDSGFFIVPRLFWRIKRFFFYLPWFCDHHVLKPYY